MIPAGMTPDLHEEGEDAMHPVHRVVRASRALAAAGQQDMVWGHVAVRDHDGRGAWLKRPGLGLDEVTPSDVQLVGWDGTLLEGSGKPHIESFIHLCALKAREDANVSVHSHPAAVNAFSALDIPLRALSHEGVLFAEPQIPRSTLPGDLIRNADLGDELATTLGSSPACLMPRHGLLAVGPTEAAAVMHAVLLEAACAIHLRAAAAGEIRSFSDTEELAAKRAHVWPPSQLEAGYSYLCRRFA